MEHGEHKYSDYQEVILWLFVFYFTVTNAPLSTQDMTGYGMVCNYFGRTVSFVVEIFRSHGEGSQQSKLVRWNHRLSYPVFPSDL